VWRLGRSITEMTSRSDDRIRPNWAFSNLLQHSRCQRRKVTLDLEETNQSWLAPGQLCWWKEEDLRAMCEARSVYRDQLPIAGRCPIRRRMAASLLSEHQLPGHVPTRGSARWPGLGSVRLSLEDIARPDSLRGFSGCRCRELPALQLAA